MTVVQTMACLRLIGRGQFDVRNSYGREISFRVLDGTSPRETNEHIPFGTNTEEPK